jgi:hypothetical protein
MQCSFALGECDWRPKLSFSLIRQMEISGHDANYRKILATQFYRATNHIRLRTKPSLPESGTDDHNLLAPGLIFFREKLATSDRLHTECFEQSR